MAASRSMLEALLARVQKRANEPRAVPPAMPANDRAPVSAAETQPPGRAELAEEDIEEYDDELIEIIDDAEVIPQAAAAARAIEPAAFGATLDRRSAAASLKPAAGSGSGAAAAGSAGSVSGSAAGSASASAAAGAAVSAGAGAATRGAVSAASTAATAASSSGAARPQAARPTPTAEALRPESVSPRPIAATDIARAQGTRRELRTTSFLELLDASLKLGS